MDENQEKLVNQVTKSLTDTVEKALPELVESAVKVKTAELEAKTISEISEIKEALKGIKFNSNADEATKALKVKTLIVDTVKDVLLNNVQTEKGFQDLLIAKAGEMGENVAADGGNIVFEQFQADIIMELAQYEVINDTRIITIAKGNKVTFPTVTAGVTTSWKAELASYVNSKPTLGNLSIDIDKATTLVDFSEELLNDNMSIPDLYRLLVELIAESQAGFIEGEIWTGTNAVDAILSATNLETTTLAATKTKISDVTDANIVTMMDSINRKYKRRTANLKFYMGQPMLTHLKNMKDGAGMIMYPELRTTNPTLYGYKVVLTDSGFSQTSAADAGKYAILFGDLSYYTIARVKALTFEQGYYGANWAADIRSLKANQRLWGKLSIPKSLAAIKLAAA